MPLDLEQVYRDALIWDAHAGVFPSPEVELDLLEEWHANGVSYLSINVGFDVMQWHETLATLAAYRRALALAPEKAEIWNNLAYALAQLGRHEASMEAIRHALEIDPESQNLRDSFTELSNWQQ